MAVIEKRPRKKDGKDQYRVKIRLKGHPPLTSTHARLMGSPERLSIPGSR